MLQQNLLCLITEPQPGLYSHAAWLAFTACVGRLKRLYKVLILNPYKREKKRCLWLYVWLYARVLSCHSAWSHQWCLLCPYLIQSPFRFWTTCMQSPRPWNRIQLQKPHICNWVMQNPLSAQKDNPKPCCSKMVLVFWTIIKRWWLAMQHCMHCHCICVQLCVKYYTDFSLREMV